MSVADFLACADAIVQLGYGTAGHIVASAASAGGITVGRAVVERPELFSGAFLSSAILNPLRHERMPVGSANVPEFGTVSDPAERRALLAVDAYSGVTQGTHYPPILLNVGLNDARVPVWQSAKLAARLLEVGSPESVLLRVTPNSGHFTASELRVDRYVDTLAFFLWRAGAPEFQPR